MWKKLSDEEREVYYRVVREEKLEYRRQMKVRESSNTQDGVSFATANNKQVTLEEDVERKKCGQPEGTNLTKKLLLKSAVIAAKMKFP